MWCVVDRVSFGSCRFPRSIAPNESQCCTRENYVFSIGNITFFANFDSGNLARVEQEELPASSGLSFSTWTRPDCHVTKFEKRSWSWFFFGVAGVPSESNLDHGSRLEPSQPALQPWHAACLAGGRGGGLEQSWEDRSCHEGGDLLHHIQRHSPPCKESFVICTDNPLHIHTSSVSAPHS